MPARPTLAIISTYGELCGIAAYTHRLERYLDDAFEVTVLPLDQSVLRSEAPRRMRLAERHIDDLCARVKGFEYVNIQYEPGTLGPTGRIALRRLRRLVKASPAVSVTFHTFVPATGLPVLRLLKDAAKLKPGAALEGLREWWRTRAIGPLVFRLLKAQQRRKHVSLIVQTRREARYLTLDYDFENVFDHPLAFLRDEDVAEARSEASRDLFPPLRDVPPEAKIVGVFGFVAPYKGTLTAVRAMRYLPEQYHLAIFGGIHPAEIKEKVEVNEYLAEILAEIAGISPDGGDEEGLTGLERIAVGHLKRHKGDISHRVHFMGPLDDDQFARGMCLCDTVALPYLEVGQTSSGPVSIAVELGCRVVVSRNHAFAQFAGYHADRLDFFDIGNHVELADRVLRPYTTPRRTPFGYRTNRDVYLRAHGQEPAAAEAGVASAMAEPKPRPVGAGA